MERAWPSSRAARLILVDCGVTFDDRGLGVDVVHPDFSALERHSASVASS